MRFFNFNSGADKLFFFKKNLLSNYCKTRIYLRSIYYRLNSLFYSSLIYKMRLEGVGAFSS